MKIFIVSLVLIYLMSGYKSGAYFFDYHYPTNFIQYLQFIGIVLFFPIIWLIGGIIILIKMLFDKK